MIKWSYQDAPSWEFGLSSSRSFSATAADDEVGLVGNDFALFPACLRTQTASARGDSTWKENQRAGKFFHKNSTSKNGGGLRLERTTNNIAAAEAKIAGIFTRAGSRV